MIRSMRPRKLARGVVLLLVTLMIGGCGTFFPKAPAERAADRVLDDVFPPRESAAGNVAGAEPKKP